jgi:hypothetical protein
MPKVKVHDIWIYYEVRGEGFPLLMIPGSYRSSEIWPPDLVEDFSNRFKMVLYDPRGTGRSDKPDIDYSMRIMADDATGLLDALNLFPSSRTGGFYRRLGGCGTCHKPPRERRTSRLGLCKLRRTKQDTATKGHIKKEFANNVCDHESSSRNILKGSHGT